MIPEYSQKDSADSDQCEISVLSLCGNILVVDDSTLDAERLRSHLAELGLEISVVYSGAAAVDRRQRKQFDCIFIDLQMPGMDGFATARQLRNLEDRRHIPLIAMTAAATSESRRQCLDAGFDDYLPKLVSTLKLQEILVKWLRVPN